MSFWAYGSALSEPPIISSPNPISSRIRAYVPKAIQTVEHLAAAEDSDGKTLALIGAREGRLEMLFVGSSCRGGA